MRPSSTRARRPFARRAGLGLALALCASVGLGTGCPKPPSTTEPEPEPVDEPAEELVDAPALCAAGCEQLAACVPKLATELDGDPAEVAARLVTECESACTQFEDQRSSLALRDCLDLDSCAAYWGCVAAPNVQPWLATVAPTGDRSCANLCSQASACAIAKVCEQEEPRAAQPQDADLDRPVDPSCAQGEARRTELEEICLLQCETAPEDSQARAELIGCIDHASCDGMLGCLDSWSATDYGDSASGELVPGVSPTCDGLCTRAIVCGAAEGELELEPSELAELKQRMTSTYVECAVQCGKDLDVGGDEARAAFEACTASEDCETFTTCANKV